jgi:hypothetical protein
MPAQLSSELARIDDELRRAYDGDAWHGPPLREVLEGVTAEVAAFRHPAPAHSIWGIINHLAAWAEVAALRLTERRAVEQPAAGDFPSVTDTSAGAWEKALDELDRQHRSIPSIFD